MIAFVQADARALPLEDNSVDLVVTSPPYADQRRKTYGGIHPDRYVEWFMPIGEEIRRVLNPTGSFVLNIKEKVVDGERHTYVLDLIKALRNQGWLWTEEYIWHKKNAHPGYWPNRFRDAWERCLHFTKGRKFFMDQQAVAVPAGDWQAKRLPRESRNDGTRLESASGSGFGRKVSNWMGKTTALPTNVLQVAPVSRNIGHPAPFPIGLPRFFIRLLTGPGQMVLDPFGGAGTTALAAHELGRDAVMVERKGEYIEIARRRLANHRPHKAEAKKIRDPKPEKTLFELEVA